MPMVNVQMFAVKDKHNVLVGKTFIFAPMIKFAQMTLIQSAFAQTNVMQNNQIVCVEVKHLLSALQIHIVGESKKTQNKRQRLVEIIYASTNMPTVYAQMLVLQVKLNALVGKTLKFAPMIKFAQMRMNKSVSAQTNVRLNNRIAYVEVSHLLYALKIRIVGEEKKTQN